jgi:nucleoside phosphorylase
MDIRSKQIDIAIYVALNEEFVYVKEELGVAFRPVEIADVAITCFFGQIRSDTLNYSFNVIVVPAGKMGNTRSGNIMSMIVDRYKPSDVVVIGIAGSLNNDLQPGDVFIPDRVNEYLANSATSGEREWTFQTSGNHFITAPRLINRFQMIESTQKKSYNKWRRIANRNLVQLIDRPTRESLRIAGLEIQSECKLHVGDDKALASGPAVGKGKAFVDWVRKEVDRKIVAMEMESAGVYDAALIRTPAPRAIAIRGISDFADERKEKLETAAKERFRTLAVKNTVSLLVNAIQAGLFKKDAAPALEGVISPTPKKTSTGKYNLQITNAHGMVIGDHAQVTQQFDSSTSNARGSSSSSTEMGSVASQLHQLLVARFDLEEFRTLCFKLGVDYDDLRGEGRSAKARELVQLMQRQDELNRLQQIVQQAIQSNK